MIPASPLEYVQKGSLLEIKYPANKPPDNDIKKFIVIPLSVVGVTYMFVAVQYVTPSIPYSGPRSYIGILHAA